MAKDFRSLIPLLTISHDGTTVRFAAWPESIRSHGEQYEPFPFMFVLDEWNTLTAWKRVEIHLDQSAVTAAFSAPFPGESPIKASVQVVTEQDRDSILQRVDGVLTFDEDKVYFEPLPKPPTG